MPLDPRIRKRIRELIASLDEQIDAARKALAAGDKEAARRALGAALDFKYLILEAIPDTDVGFDANSERVTVRFIHLYSSLREADEAAALALLTFITIVTTDGTVVMSPERAHERLHRAIEDLERGLLNLPWDDDDERPFLERLLAKLRALLQTAERSDDLLDPNRPTRFELLQGLEALKAELLDQLSVWIPLWDAYWFLKEIDYYLENANRRLVTTGAADDEIRTAIDKAEELKHTFERVVDGAKLAPRPKQPGAPAGGPATAPEPGQGGQDPAPDPPRPAPPGQHHV